MRRPALLIAASLLAPSVHALEALATYDRFSADGVNASRWTNTDLVREVVDGKLRVFNRAVASKAGNTGSLYQNWGVNYSDPAAVTAIGATVTVTRIDIDACAANADSGWVAARITGSFFNVGTATPNSLVGDVIAQARVMRSAASTDPDGTLRVVGVVTQCSTADCNGAGGRTLKSIDLGTVTVGTPVKLSVRWDRAGNRFHFRRDSQASKAYTYSVSDRSAPGQPFKALQVRAAVENCTAGGRTGYAEALFDNAVVNESAAP